jgi:hypothetical protein
MQPPVAGVSDPGYTPPVAGVSDPGYTLETDRTAYELMQQGKETSEFTLKSHAAAKEQVGKSILDELEIAPDSAAIETGVHKFVEWIRSGKLEIKAHPAHNLHAKVYIMTFAHGDRDKGRVITGSFP